MNEDYLFYEIHLRMVLSIVSIDRYSYKEKDFRFSLSYRLAKAQQYAFLYAICNSLCETKVVSRDI